jgi:hypothetical protein
MEIEGPRGESLNLKNSSIRLTSSSRPFLALTRAGDRSDLHRPASTIPLLSPRGRGLRALALLYNPDLLRSAPPCSARQPGFHGLDPLSLRQSIPTGILPLSLLNPPSLSPSPLPLSLSLPDRLSTTASNGSLWWD